MTHAKVLLVDDAALVLGSANFDANSLDLQPEVMGIFREPSLIAQYRERVLKVDLDQARAPRGREIAQLRGWIGYRLTRIGEGILAMI